MSTQTRFYSHNHPLDLKARNSTQKIINNKVSHKLHDNIGGWVHTLIVHGVIQLTTGLIAATIHKAQYLHVSAPSVSR